MLKLAFHSLTVVAVTASFRGFMSESAIFLIGTGLVVVEIVTKWTTTTGCISNSSVATIVAISILVSN